MGERNLERGERSCKRVLERERGGREREWEVNPKRDRTGNSEREEDTKVEIVIVRGFKERDRARISKENDSSIGRGDEIGNKNCKQREDKSVKGKMREI